VSSAAKEGPIAEENYERWLHEEAADFQNLSYVAFLQGRSLGEEARPALIHRERTWSYRELFSQVESMAGVLNHTCEVRKGDRVLLQLDNSDLYVLCYFAILLAGAIAVPINPKLTEAEVAHILTDSQPVLYIGSSLDPGPGRGGQKVSAVLAPELCRLSSRSPSLGARAEDAAAIFYTSGTTGRPKGVVHTHATLMIGALASARAWGYDKPGLTTLAVTPLFHIAAHAWFYPVLANRGTLVVDNYQTDRVLELIEKYQIASFGAVPAMLLMMAERAQSLELKFPNVKNVRFGASPMPPDRLRDIASLFPNAGLFHGMGQTESGGTISVLPSNLAFIKNGATGFPIPGCRVRIVDKDDADVPDGMIGEVLARSPQVMREYFGKTEATQTTLRNGWLHTGDLGYRDADGCIYLVDRIKDMIIRGGENIYSVEVESVLSEHPAVSASAVVGCPDSILGERVFAFVVLADASLRDFDEALRTHCQAHLAAFKIPEKFIYVDELPRTATGKIQKVDLRRQLAEAAARKSSSGAVNADSSA
jgi:acyl-CoA synthetase (AMP-forming)/AMP-acid ligase II